jgi:hypothetical protein
MKRIKQKYYGTLEIDNREKDMIMIWCREGKSNEVIHIERGNIKKVIELLKEL